jgi:integrase
MKTDSNLPVIVETHNQDLTESQGDVKMLGTSYWEKDYLHERIDAIENTDHKMLITFLWMTGVRVSEAINLLKGNIDYQNYTATIRWQKKEKRGGKWMRRVIPLHPMLRNILQVYTASMLADKLVFPLSRVRVWQLTKKYLGGNPHKIRHSFAVNFLRQGGNIVTLSQLLGHSDIRITMEYLKIVPVDQGKELMKVNF